MYRLRRSALETFDGCPYKFQVLYELCRDCGHRVGLHDGERCQGTADQPCLCTGFQHVEDRGDESQRGIGFHEVAFRYIDRLAKAGLRADAGEASLAFREGVALAQLPSRLVDQVKRLWVPFAEWFQLDLDAYFAAEALQVSAFCMNCSWRGAEADVVYKGGGTPTDPVVECCPDCQGPVSASTWTPDLVYVRPHEVEITDWKTYYKGLTEEQARQEFQLKFYLWQAMHLWPGFPSYRFTFNFTRLRYSVSVAFRPDEIEAFSDEVKAITLGIYEAKRTAQYPAIPGSHCALCRLKCPVVDNPYRLPVRITRPEERDALASRILTLEQELRAAKKVLRGYCETAGGFRFRGETFAFWPETTRRYPADEVLTWLKEQGKDVSAVTVSTTALGDHAHPKRASEATRDFLGSVVIETQKWPFRHRKVGDDPAGLVDLLGDDDGDE